MTSTWGTLPSQIEHWARPWGYLRHRYLDPIGDISLIALCVLSMLHRFRHCALIFSDKSRNVRWMIARNARFPSTLDNRTVLRYDGSLIDLHRDEPRSRWLILFRLKLSRKFDDFNCRCYFRVTIASLRQHMSTRDYSSCQLSCVMHSSTFGRHRIALTSKKWTHVDDPLIVLSALMLRRHV